MRLIPATIFVAVALMLGLALAPPVTAATTDGPLSIAQLDRCRVQVTYTDNAAEVLGGALTVRVNGAVAETIAAGGLDTGPGNDDSATIALDVEDGDTVTAAIADTDYDVSIEADCGGSITFELDLDGLDDSRVRFDFDPGDDFSLRDGEDETIGDLEDDEYVLTFDTDGYVFADVECEGISARRVERSARRVEIDLNGEDVTCTLDVERQRATATPTATPSPVNTPTPLPTQAPIFVPVPGPERVVERIVTVTVPAPVISPPNSGDGGLIN